MSLTRREFIAGTAASAGAFCCAGCIVTNKAPTFDADARGMLPAPEALSKPGSQIKVRIPGNDDIILVWRTDQGLGAASVRCTHKGCEVEFNPQENTLDCPCHGSRFKPDGKVIEGPAKSPLRSYRILQVADRLRLNG